jgi:hypothetical protein
MAQRVFPVLGCPASQWQSVHRVWLEFQRAQRARTPVRIGSDWHCHVSRASCHEPECLRRGGHPGARWGSPWVRWNITYVVNVCGLVRISLSCTQGTPKGGIAKLAELVGRQQSGVTVPGLDGNISLAESHLDELNNRLENRRAELRNEKQCTIGDIQHLGRAWVLPHPERNAPGIAFMVRDEEIERIAIQEARKYETTRGWEVESVEADNRGFDLISRKPHPHDVKTFTDVRFIEVKGRVAIGEVALSFNEYKTAERLKRDYWLYAVFNCGSKPELHAVQDPARLGWEPIVKIDHYHTSAERIIGGESK